MVTTPKIAEVLTRRSYFNTFGGNPACTAAGLAVLQVIEREKLQENAFVVGSYLKERLTGLMDKYEGKVSWTPYMLMDCLFFLATAHKNMLDAFNLCTFITLYTY